MNEHIAQGIKAVIFDHDDTLVGTIESKWAQHKQIARVHYGKRLLDEEIRQHWGKPLQELVCLLYGTNDVDEAMRLNTACRQDFPKRLFEATISVLKRIKSADKLVGIVTATSRLSFEHDLDSHHIPAELVDYKQTSEDTTFHKPDSRVFAPAVDWLEARGVKPAEVVYVGDGLHDMKAALGAGFSFLGVETGLVGSGEFSRAGAKSISSIKDLLDR
jgi:phosphoglycolate phosphatase-like HAD superfamily hydrolase